jgi:hypothetical protein
MSSAPMVIRLRDDVKMEFPVERTGVDGASRLGSSLSDQFGCVPVRALPVRATEAALGYRRIQLLGLACRVGEGQSAGSASCMSTP